MAGKDRTRRLTPTLFDKLLAGHEISDTKASELDQLEQKRDTMRTLSFMQGQRFTERALRATIRRELAWLFNTTNFEAVTDLEKYPQISTSVLNYGVPYLAGKSLNDRVVRRRTRELRAAIIAFEPRIDPASLEVDVSEQTERENAVTYVISADITSALGALPVKFRTDVEADTSAVTVRD